jgi:hypothetical protein
MMRREDFPRPFFAHVVSMRSIAFYWATLDFLSKVIGNQVSAIHERAPHLKSAFSAHAQVGTGPLPD